MKATDFLMSPAKFYKGNHIKFRLLNTFKHLIYLITDKDTRCLKPNSNPDPTQWEHYVPEDFVNATSQVTFFNKLFMCIKYCCSYHLMQFLGGIRQGKTIAIYIENIHM